nr:hypothetical protein GCM10020093_092170 [Planobispora longispora]
MMKDDVVRAMSAACDPAAKGMMTGAADATPMPRISTRVTPSLSPMSRATADPASTPIAPRDIVRPTSWGEKSSTRMPYSR